MEQTDPKDPVGPAVPPVASPYFGTQPRASEFKSPSVDYSRIRAPRNDTASDQNEAFFESVLDLHDVSREEKEAVRLKLQDLGPMQGSAYLLIFFDYLMGVYDNINSTAFVNATAPLAQQIEYLAGISWSKKHGKTPHINYDYPRKCDEKLRKKLNDYPWSTFCEKIVVFKNLDLNPDAIKNETLRLHGILSQFRRHFHKFWPEAFKQLWKPLQLHSSHYPYAKSRISFPVRDGLGEPQYANHELDKVIALPPNMCENTTGVVIEEVLDLRGDFDKGALDVITETGVVTERIVREVKSSFSSEYIRLLGQEIVAAQTKPPKDKQEFANNVNWLLDTFGLRIEAEDRKQYRLRVLPGADGRGHIQLVGTKRGVGRGFKNAKIQLVPCSVVTRLTTQIEPK